MEQYGISIIDRPAAMPFAVPTIYISYGFAVAVDVDRHEVHTVFIVPLGIFGPFRCVFDRLFKGHLERSSFMVAVCRLERIHALDIIHRFRSRRVGCLFRGGFFGGICFVFLNLRIVIDIPGAYRSQSGILEILLQHDLGLACGLNGRKAVLTFDGLFLAFDFDYGIRLI